MTQVGPHRQGTRTRREGRIHGDATLTSAPAGRPTVDVPLTAAVLDQSHIGVAVCDADGRLVELNGALACMLGTPYLPIHIAEWSTRYHLYDECGARPLAPDEAPLARALRGERVTDAIVVTRAPGRELRFLRCNASPIAHADGTPAGAVVFVVDATARIEERHRLDALRDRLVTTVNHELRTPAASLRGHVELLAELREALPAEAAWSVEVLSRNLERMQDVLDRISELADRATAAQD